MVSVIVTHPCCAQPHAPHAFPIVHPSTPGLISMVSCPGVRVKLIQSSSTNSSPKETP